MADDDDIPQDLCSFDYNFDFDFDLDTSLIPVISAAEKFSNASPDSNSLSIDEIESLLMKDDDYLTVPEHNHPNDVDFPNDFLSEILLDSPVESDDHSGVVISDVSDDNNNNKLKASSDEEKLDDVLVQKDDDMDGFRVPDDDPNSKKRQRQLRNKDAALRSRERRKMYVRDLEMKSRFFEGECKRLGMLLQCYLAENQALRLSLHKTKPFGASMTKQESAVLLLESLLLGSLLWFMGVICLLIPTSLHLTVELPIPLESAGNGDQATLAPRKSRSKICVEQFQSTMSSRRCRASKIRMKPGFLLLQF